MYKQRKNKVSVKKIANFLKTNYKGKNFDVSSVSSLNNIKNNSVLFYSDIINFISCHIHVFLPKFNNPPTNQW